MAHDGRYNNVGGYTWVTEAVINCYKEKDKRRKGIIVKEDRWSPGKGPDKGLPGVSIIHKHMPAPVLSQNGN